MREPERGVPEHALAHVERLHELGDRYPLGAPGGVRADEQQILAGYLALGVQALDAGVQVRDDVGADVCAELLIRGTVGRHVEHDPLRGGVGHRFQTLLERLSERDDRRVPVQSRLSSGAIVRSTQLKDRNLGL